MKYLPLIPFLLLAGCRATSPVHVTDFRPPEQSESFAETDAAKEQRSNDVAYVSKTLEQLTRYQDKSTDLQPGMTPEQVRVLLGSPFGKVGMTCGEQTTNPWPCMRWVYRTSFVAGTTISTTDLALWFGHLPQQTNWILNSWDWSSNP